MNRFISFAPKGISILIILSAATLAIIGVWGFSSAYAEPIRVTFSGTVTSLSEGYNIPGINIGDAVSGVLTFDPTVTDSQPHSQLGLYQGAITSLNVTIGAKTFVPSLPPANEIDVINDDFITGYGYYDYLLFRSLVVEPSNPGVSRFFQLTFWQSATSPPLMLTSDALPTSFDLDAFGRSGFVTYFPPSASQGSNFTLTSATMAPVPEPITMVTKYYNDILDRAPEPGGAESWVAEIERIVSLGIDINEGFIAIGKVFFNSPEYLSMEKSDTDYILDLYRTFLSRIPSQPEVDSWLDVLAQGVSRNVVLNFFVFSPEYNTYMGGLFGASTARPENNLVNDFYRGILSRVPDTGGFNYWLGLMRTAQCTGAQQVRDLSYQIASLFVGSAEYDGRARTDSGFVEDLYDSILRRTAAPWEINYWLNYLGTATREQVLQGFTGSAEFQTRVQAVIDAGCL